MKKRISNITYLEVVGLRILVPVLELVFNISEVFDIMMWEIFIIILTLRAQLFCVAVTEIHDATEVRSLGHHDRYVELLKGEEMCWVWLDYVF